MLIKHTFCTLFSSVPARAILWFSSRGFMAVQCSAYACDLQYGPIHEIYLCFTLGLLLPPQSLRAPLIPNTLASPLLSMPSKYFPARWLQIAFLFAGFEVFSSSLAPVECAVDFYWRYINVSIHYTFTQHYMIIMPIDWVALRLWLLRTNPAISKNQQTSAQKRT